MSDVGGDPSPLVITFLIERVVSGWIVWRRLPGQPVNTVRRARNRKVPRTLPTIEAAHAFVRSEMRADKAAARRLGLTVKHEISEV
jgi:hypothetical protein